MKRHLSPQTAGHTAGAGVGGQTTGGLEGQGVPLQGSASRTFPQVHGGGGSWGWGTEINLVPTLGGACPWKSPSS